MQPKRIVFRFESANAAIEVAPCSAILVARAAITNPREKVRCKGPQPPCPSRRAVAAGIHGATTVDDHAFDHSRFSSELDSLIAKCTSQGFDSLGLNRVREEALKHSANFSRSLMPAAAIHGDFLAAKHSPGGWGPGVIDFASCSRAAPVNIDLAHFVAYLLLLSRKTLYDSKTIEHVIQKFWGGYARKLNLGIFQLYVLRTILRITSDSSRVQTPESTETIGEGLSIVLTDNSGG